MKIIDLTEEYKDQYFICLEDWSDQMKEAGSHKKNWYNKMKEKGLRVKLSLNDGGIVTGMIEYLPVEHSIADGHDLYFISCIWVHAHKQGRGRQTKKGYGKALLEAAEADAKAMGAKGMAAYGITLPFWIPASFFKKQGYTVVAKNGIARLLFKPFFPDAKAPVLIKEKKKPKKNRNPGKVTVTYLLTGNCPSGNIVFERAKRAAAEYGEKVVFETVDTSDRETYLEWGAYNTLYIEDKSASSGPPLSYEKIKNMIGKQVLKLK